MAKKIKGKFGTYTNHGLGNVIRLNHEVIEEMTNIINNDKEIIKTHYLKVIERLDVFIKDKIGSYADADDFANYFFDKKKINEWGENLPKITEEEVLNSAIEYVKQLEEKLKTLTLEKQKEDNFLTTFKWLKQENSLIKLYQSLIASEFISENTKYDCFKYVFSNLAVNDLNDKIIWLKMGRNKNVNKKSISDLIIVLINKCYIEKKESLPKLLSYCFKSEKKELNFTYSNLSKEEDFSEHRIELENIVGNLNL